jgi:hypothetical protein
MNKSSNTIDIFDSNFLERFKELLKNYELTKNVIFIQQNDEFVFGSDHDNDAFELKRYAMGMIIVDDINKINEYNRLENKIFHTIISNHIQCETQPILFIVKDFHRISEYDSIKNAYMIHFIYYGTTVKK